MRHDELIPEQLRQPPRAAVPSRRHLLYHLMPKKGTGVWQWNIDRLLSRVGLFNGIRAVAIIRDPGCDPPDAVKEAFAGTRVDHWIIADNSPALREVKTWKPLWQTLQGESGYVWYGQAKGVTRPVNRGTTIHRWARLLYAANLDYWPIVEEMLQRYVIVGALKKVGRGFMGSRSTWHYSGSFFWARLAEALPHVDQIDSVWWGNESWPGRHFSPAEAGCIGGVEGRVPEFDAYLMSRFNRIEADHQRWAAQHVRKRVSSYAV